MAILNSNLNNSHHSLYLKEENQGKTESYSFSICSPTTFTLTHPIRRSIVKISSIPIRVYIGIDSIFIFKPTCTIYNAEFTYFVERKPRQT